MCVCVCGWMVCGSIGLLLPRLPKLPSQWRTVCYGKAKLTAILLTIPPSNMFFSLLTLHRSMCARRKMRKPLTEYSAIRHGEEGWEVQRVHKQCSYYSIFVLEIHLQYSFRTHKKETYNNSLYIWEFCTSDLFWNHTKWSSIQEGALYTHDSEDFFSAFIYWYVS